MLGLGSALALLVVGFGVDLAAEIREPDRGTAQGSDGDDTSNGTTPIHDDTSHEDAQAPAPSPEPEHDPELVAERAPAPVQAPEPAQTARLAGPDDGETLAETNADIELFLAGDTGGDTATDAEGGDFLAFLDGPDGLFEPDTAQQGDAPAPEPAAQMDDDTVPDPVADVNDTAQQADAADSPRFDRDELFGEHSIEDLFAEPGAGANETDTAEAPDLFDYMPGDEKLVLAYDDDGGPEPRLDISTANEAGQRIATIRVDDEIAARVALADGARDLQADDIALIAES